MIFIGDIHKIRYNWETENIRDLLINYFSKFGGIKHLEVIRYFRGNPMFAYITYEREQDTCKVLDIQNHSIINGYHEEESVEVRRYIKYENLEKDRAEKSETRLQEIRKRSERNTNSNFNKWTKFTP